jgi:hypothetical protein
VEHHVADNTPDDPSTPIPPIVDLTGNGAAPDEATVVRPRKKAAPKAVPPENAAPAVPPVEAAPAVAAAAAAAPEIPASPEIPVAPAVNPYAQPAAATPSDAQSNPYAQPNPYATPAPAAPNPYGQPGAPYAQPYAYAPQPPKGLSITSMVLGIAGVVFSFCYGFGFFFGLAAVITGHMSVKRQPYAKPFWLTGIITGYVTIGIALLWVLIIGGIFLWSASYSGYNY